MKKRLLPKAFSHWPVYSVAVWVLCGFAIAATLILDHRNWTRGERSYIFTGSREKGAAPPRPEAALPAIETPAEKALPEKVPEPAPREAPKTAAAGKEPSALKRPSAPLGKVALIVDDMGNSPEALEELLALGEPLTIAVLPYSPHALETAQKAHERGLEVLLHLPLESLNGNGSENGTEGLIRSGMGEAEVRSLLEEELDRIPFVRGVNNHMGSKVTADAGMMRAILQPIRERGLFFLDSRTTAKSVAYDVAVDMGMPAASRQVFLDADGDTARIRERLLELFRIARRDGRAVGICHPFRETLRTLKENFGRLRSYGLEAVLASEMVGR